MNIEIWAALTIGLLVYLATEFVTARELQREFKKVEDHLLEILKVARDNRGMLKNSNVDVKYNVFKNKKIGRSK